MFPFALTRTLALPLLLTFAACVSPVAAADDEPPERRTETEAGSGGADAGTGGADPSAEAGAAGSATLGAGGKSGQAGKTAAGGKGGSASGGGGAGGKAQGKGGSPGGGPAGGKAGAEPATAGSGGSESGGSPAVGGMGGEAAGGAQGGNVGAAGKGTAGAGGAMIPPEPACPYAKTSTPGDVLRLRPDPSTSGAPLAALPDGTIVTVLGEVQGQDVAGSTLWYHVKTGGQTGYIYAKYAVCTKEKPPA